MKNIDYINRSFELGFFIAPQYHGKGYGKIVVKKLVDYSFKKLRTHRVYIEVFADNDKASKLYEKHGFKKVGVRNSNFAGVSINGGRSNS